MSIQRRRPRCRNRSIHRLLALAATGVLPAGLVQATIYTDTLGDQAGTSPGYVDIAGVNVTNDAANLTIQISVNPSANFLADDGSQQYGKFLIGFQTGPGGSTALADPTAWGNPIGISTGMNYWVGGWTNVANSTPPPAFFGYNVVEHWNGADWEVIAGQDSAPFVDTPTTLTNTALTISIPLSTLGLAAGNSFGFDVWSTFDGGQSVYDSAARPSTAIADPWNLTPYDAAGNLLNYTVTSTTTSATWTGTTSGNWSDPGNWTGGVPDGIDHSASFGSIVSGNFAVAIDGAAKTVGSITFDSATSYTLGTAGGNGLTLQSAGAAAITVVSGSHTIAAPLTLSSDTTVAVTPAGSTLTASSLQSSTHSITKTGTGNFGANNVRAATLTINSGTVTILHDGSNTGASKITALAIAGGAAPTATLDLDNNDLVTGTAKATIEAQVKHARNVGLWNQSGITSSAARTNASGNTGLGVISGAEYTSFGGTGTFSGQAYVAGDTLVKYTWNGDTNFSGTINFDDYVRTDIGFNTHLTGWSNGDFDYSGGVNFDDYVMIDVAFNTQSGTLGRAVNYLSGDDRSSVGLNDPGVQKVIEHFGEFGAPYASAFLAAVPEPSMLYAAAPVLCAIGGRRRRR